jgi:signal transduction histidine kinase/ActR/RegA family two-component response regulator
MRRLRNFGLLLPTATLALAAMAVFVLSLVLWSRGVDERARSREEVLVNEGLALAVAEVERAIVPETVWDEAVQNLDHRRDIAWAEVNLNDFYALGYDFSEITVVDEANQAFYHRIGRRSAPPASADLSDHASLLELVRRMEASRRPTAAAREGAVQASAFIDRKGELALATATLVQPDTDAVRLTGSRAPILITLLPIDQVAVELLQHRYLLQDLRSGLGTDHVRPGDATAQFKDLGDDSLPMTLAWRPQRPGHDLLMRSIGPVAGVLLAFGAVAAVMVLRARAAWRQEQLAQKTQAEFLANMSHEIRTPLNGVCAVADALERTSLTPMQQEMVQIIRSSGVSLERLLSDLLDVSRIETGAVRITPEPFRLAEAARTVISLLAPRAAEKNLELNLTLDPAAEATVIGDSVRLKQILANLVGNAIKFTEAGRVNLVVEATGEGRWRLTVSDTGPGFDASRKAALFQRFVQGDATISRRFGGMGLGLAICRELAELMGGSIDAESRPGEGARFWVDLPLPVTQAPANNHTDPAQADERPLRILVADDHPTNRQVLELLLSQFDTELVLAENGQQALEAFEKAPFDIVLMDMQMPVMDGLTAIREIRAREERSDLTRTPIIMLTANTLPEHQAASLEAGADMHMPKPIVADRLFEALASVSERPNAA